MSNDEISNAAINALMDAIANMISKGKPNKGLTEDEHAIAMAHVMDEVDSLATEKDGVKVVGNMPLKTARAIAIRAVKNGSQMRQVAEKRKILEVSQKGDAVTDLFAKYA